MCAAQSGRGFNPRPARFSLPYSTNSLHSRVLNQ